ncbi:MAG: biotin/lipoyl-binding protein [Fibromonadaceae bacterium]|jgi:predicted RecA/RadA family phage recombinase|nr:biotin/lipoyl-binding protein [Fibromonadaceae bacterium]
MNKPAKTDEMVRVIDINAWVALLTVLAVIAGGLTWGFLGNLLMRENTSGVIVRSGKIINIYATGDFHLLDLNIESGGYVEMGQVIARADRPELVVDVNKSIVRNAPIAEINTKRARLIEESQIITPETGRVVDVFVHSGDFVRKGDKIATILKEAADGKAMECSVFMLADQVKNIRKGMNVNIYPAGVNKKMYGNMTGIVAWISEYPVTENYMLNLLSSKELAQDFLKNGAVYEIYINLVTSEETATGYAWTTSFGPPNKFGNITLLNASVITEKMRPIDLLFSR